MNKVTLFIFVAVIAFLVSGFVWINILRSKNKLSNIQSNNMELSSPAFQKNQQIPEKYSCKGASVNPPLSISGVPTNAQSLALVLEDPDAPSGTFIHWILWNISPDLKEIIENSIPSGVTVGTNSAGSQKFVGPCPPSGSHRYIFKLYALDTSLTLPEEAKRQDLDTVMKDHIVGEAELLGVYP